MIITTPEEQFRLESTLEYYHNNSANNINNNNNKSNDNATNSSDSKDIDNNTTNSKSESDEKQKEIEFFLSVRREILDLLEVIMMEIPPGGK